MNIRPWSTSPTDYIAVNACLRPLAAVHEMDVSDVYYTPQSKYHNRFGLSSTMCLL